MTFIARTQTPRARLALAALASAGLTLSAVSVAPTAGAAPDQKPAGPTIALPDGFQPEGIAIAGRTAYFGSLANGDIYAVDLRNGEGDILSEGPGTSSVGLEHEPVQNRLYVSGGGSGTARVVDAGSGDIVADYSLTEGPAFVNDVIVTKRAAWFTNSAAPELFRVPITKKGQLPAESRVRTLPLRGDWEQPAGFGANGITETPDGKALLVVNSEDGTLFRVAKKGKRAGKATQVDLDGQSLTNGDGMLQKHRTLYVVRNQLNKVVKLKLDKRGLTGRKTGVLTSKTFDVPTTIAARRGRLYLPNARFGTEPTPETPYTASVIRKR